MDGEEISLVRGSSLSQVSFFLMIICEHFLVLGKSALFAIERLARVATLKALAKVHAKGMFSNG